MIIKRILLQVLILPIKYASTKYLKKLSTLDLSLVGYALAAAEPNRYTTMTQFCSKFARCGFKTEANCVGYGLAENTLHVTTNKPQKNSDFLSLSKKSLTKGMVLNTQEEQE